MSDLNLSVNSNSNGTGTDGIETVNVSAAVDGTINGSKLAEGRETIRQIPFSKIVVDPARNPRKAAKYGADSAAGEKARSIWKQGLKEALVLSEQPNGDLLLMRGFLRYNGIRLIRTVGLPAIGKGIDWPAIPADSHFMDTIRCRVFKGLSPVDEMDLLMDHRDSTPLDKSELLEATLKMVRIGLTEEFIAEKLGFKSRGPASVLVRLCRMPKHVRDAYAAYADNPKAEGAVKLTDTAINKLYSAYSADKKADPSSFRTGGKEFNAEWEQLVATGPPSRGKGLPPGDLVTLAEAQDDSDLQDLLLSIANGNKLDAGTALERIRVRLDAASVEEHYQAHKANAIGDTV